MGTMIPDLLGGGQEILQGHELAVGPPPAQESLKALDFAILPACRWAGTTLRTPFFPGPLELLLPPHLRRDVHVHGAVEDLVARAAVGLGLIHGIVRIAQDLFRAGVVEGAEGDTDTGGDENLMAIQIDWEAYIVLGACGNGGYIGNISDVFEKDGKFISSEARHRILGAKAGAQARGHAAPAARPRWRGPGYRSLP